MSNKIDKLATINRRIIKDIQKELRLQGHRLTGDTERTMEGREDLAGKDLLLEGYAQSHVAVLEEGMAADRTPYDSSKVTGAGTSQYIQGLATFAKLRFAVSDKQALSIAFAIAKKHEKEGMPTSGSLAFSKTGTRTKAIESSFTRNEGKYFDQMDDVISEEFDSILFDKVKDVI